MDSAGQRVSGPSVQTTPSPPPKARLLSQAWGNEHLGQLPRRLTNSLQLYRRPLGGCWPCRFPAACLGLATEPGNLTLLLTRPVYTPRGRSCGQARCCVSGEQLPFGIFRVSTLRILQTRRTQALVLLALFSRWGTDLSQRGTLITSFSAENQVTSLRALG